MLVVEGGIIILFSSISWLEKGLWIAQMPGNVELQLNRGKISSAAFVMLS